MVAVLLVALMAGACGPVDRGNVFADRLEAHLESRDDLESFSVTGLSHLPWTGTAHVRIELPADVDEAVAVETVWEITHQDIDPWVTWNLIVTFPAVSGAGETATAATWIRVRQPAPDEPEARAFIAERMQVATDLAALGTGLTDVGATQYWHTLTSDGDALEVATAACERPELLAERSLRVVTRGGEGTGAQRRVEIGAQHCADLPDATALVTSAVPSGLTGYALRFDVADDQPVLTLHGVADPAAQEALATQAAAGSVRLTFT